MGGSAVVLWGTDRFSIDVALSRVSAKAELHLIVGSTEKDYSTPRNTRSTFSSSVVGISEFIRFLLLPEPAAATASHRVAEPGLRHTYSGVSLVVGICDRGRVYRRAAAILSRPFSFTVVPQEARPFSFIILLRKRESSHIKRTKTPNIPERIEGDDSHPSHSGKHSKEPASRTPGSWGRICRVYVPENSGCRSTRLTIFSSCTWTRELKTSRPT